MRMNLWELVRKVFCANKEAICVESQHAYRDRNLIPRNMKEEMVIEERKKMMERRRDEVEVQLQ